MYDKDQLDALVGNGLTRDAYATVIALERQTAALERIATALEAGERRKQRRDAHNLPDNS